MFVTKKIIAYTQKSNYEYNGKLHLQKLKL